MNKIFPILPANATHILIFELLCDCGNQTKLLI